MALSETIKQWEITVQRYLTALACVDADISVTDGICGQHPELYITFHFAMKEPDYTGVKPYVLCVLYLTNGKMENIVFDAPNPPKVSPITSFEEAFTKAFAHLQQVTL